MKILHVIPSISRIRGGPSAAIKGFILANSENEAEITLVTSDDDGEHRRITARNPNLQALKVFIKGRVYIFKRLITPFGKVNNNTISISFVYWIIFNSRKFDIIHIHSFFSFFTLVTVYVCYCNKIPCIVRPLGQLTQWSLSQGSFYKRIFIWALIPILNSRYIYLHLTSPLEYQELPLALNRVKHFILPLGVGTPQVADVDYSSNSLVKRFLFLSRVHPKKRLLELLECLSELYKEGFKDWHLDIAGNDNSEYSRMLVDHSKSLGLESQITWHGFVTDNTKALLYSKAHWFILPSFSENFGISVAEALSYGTPTIISADVGIAEYVRKYNAGIIIDNTLDSLKNALLSSSINNEKFRENARLLASNEFSWDKINSKLKSYYISFLQF